MGYVYLIEDMSNRSYKIGATRKKDSSRIKELQTGNSTELILKDSFETEFPFRLETMLHTKYKAYNLMNEWYDLPKDDIYNFKETCESLNKIIISLKDNPFFSKGLK